MNPFLGYSPDIDPVTPGILKDVTNVIPTTKGFSPVKTAVSAGLSAVSDTVNSLAVVERLDGTRVTYAGTETTLEEAVAGSWTDRSQALGYTCGVDSRWSFAQFGNITLAAQIGDKIQAATTGSSAFADADTTAPLAAHIAVSDGFVMACNLSTDADGWHCSAYLDYTDWTEAVTTQCTSGRLVGGGAITGVKKFSNGFLAFKDRSMHLASYVGAPIVFQWSEIPGDVGCPTGHAAVDIGDRIAFLGHDSFYIFDGARPVDIGQGIREWFFANANNTYFYRTLATYNVQTGNVTWFYVSSSASGNTPDAAVVYNIRSGKWGKYDISVHAVAQYYPAGVIIDGATADLSDLYSTIDDMTDVSFDSPYWSAGTANAGVIQADDILYTLTGNPDTSSMVMNTFGDDELFSTVRRIRPRFLTAPKDSTVDYYKDDSYGDNFVYKASYQLMNGKYDLLHSARWHEVHFNFSGDYEIVGVSVDVVQDGTQ